MEDESQAKPLELLTRYRALCESAGAHRATHTPLPRVIREQLEKVEAELQTRLWLSSAEVDRSVPSKPPATRGALVSAPKTVGAAPEAASTATLTVAAGRPSSSSTATVYTDGACLGNPGPGGYCAIVRISGQSERVVSGGKARTTNNEMELTAAAEGLKLAVSQAASEITVVSDSEYLVKGMTSWVRGWIRNGWKTSKGEPVKNRGLWEKLHRLSQGRSVSWSWVRGHVGHPENERCDTLAVAAAQEAASNLSRKYLRTD